MVFASYMWLNVRLFAFEGFSFGVKQCCLLALQKYVLFELPLSGCLKDQRSCFPCVPCVPVCLEPVASVSRVPLRSLGVLWSVSLWVALY